MKLILKSDWDIPLQSPLSEEETKGHFAGREKELQPLIHEILRKKNGSIFISGYRGVGKTTLVYKALSDAKKKNKKIIIVLINAAQLEAESENQKIDARRIIENLIRRLYSVTKNYDFKNSDNDEKTKGKLNIYKKIIKWGKRNIGFGKLMEIIKSPSATQHSDLNDYEELKNDIENLHRKAIAKEYRISEFTSNSKEYSKETVKEKKVEFLNELNWKNLIFFIFLVVALAFQFVEITSSEELNKVIPLLLALPISFVLIVLYKKYHRSKISEEEKITTEKLYEIDNSIGNLKYDLENIHKKISKQHYNLIYIIDELDKLDTENVMEALKFFMNFFTLSNALFIFIGGEKIYYDIENKNNYRPKEYTYFTSKYFISRPLVEDLDNYFNDICENINEVNENEFNYLKRALFFQAKNDFFNLKKCIEDRITSFDENDKPIIEIEKINYEDIQKALLHKVITILFEKNYLQSEFIQNEVLLKELFEYASLIYSSYPGDIFEDPPDELNSSEMKRISSKMIRDFNTLLVSLKAFNLQGTPKEEKRGVNVSISKYQYIGNIPIEQCGEILERYEHGYEYKNMFVKKFEIIGDYILELNNAHINSRHHNKTEVSKSIFRKHPITYLRNIDKWGFTVSNLFLKHFKIYNDIMDQKRDMYIKEDIEEMTVSIEKQTNTLLTNLPKIVGHMLMSLHKNLDPQFQLFQEETSLFNIFLDPIHNPLIITFRHKPSHQILLINDNIDLIQQNKNEIKKNYETHRIFCFTDSSIDTTIKDKEAGLHFINVESPEKLRESIIVSFKDIKKFLW